MSNPYREVKYASDAEWREARKGGVGGSDAGAVMGLNPWRTPLETWLEKTGRVEPPDLSDKQSVEWGNRLEPLVAEKFAESHPELKVMRKNCTMVSLERPWAFANIDRELRGPDGRGVLEIKTAGLRSDKDWVYGPPDHYLCQVQHYLSVTGWGYAWVAVLIGGQEYREYFIARDEEDIAAIDAAVDSFWNDYVVAGVMPKVTGGDGGALLQMHPDPHDGYVPRMDADFPQLGERVQLGLEIKALEERRKALDAEIKALIGDARGVETESVRCTWVRSKSRKLDQKRLKAEMPETYARYEEDYTRDGGLRLSPARE